MYSRTIEALLHFLGDSQDLVVTMAATVVTVTFLTGVIWIACNLLIEEVDGICCVTLGQDEIRQEMVESYSHILSL